MNFQITHTTEYTYTDPVVFCHNIATIKPRTSLGQELLDYTIDINPEPTQISERIDFFGNNITRFSIQKQHKKLSVTSKSKITRNYTEVKELFFSKACTDVTLEQALELLNANKENTFTPKQFILDSVLIRNTKSNIKAYALESFKPKR